MAKGKKKRGQRRLQPARHRPARDFPGTGVRNLALSPETLIRATIKKIPAGKVSTYGAVARAAGLAGHARQVARVLRHSFGLPWQRVLGSGGEIKLRGDSALEQRFRLQAEGVRFRGRRVDMKAHEFKFRN